MNFYKKICALVLACSMAVSTVCASLTTVNKGYLTLGLDANQDSNFVSYTENATTGVITASGFDIQLFSYIARRIGLLPKFIQYPDATAALDALNAGEVDCIGGGYFELDQYQSSTSQYLQITYFGLVTALYLQSTTGLTVENGYNIAYQSRGFAMLPVTEDPLAEGFNCTLAKQMELALNSAITNGIYTCYAVGNSANVESDVTSLYSLFVAPINQWWSTFGGYIPAPTNTAGTVVPGCAACPVQTLQVESCLVAYLQSLPGAFNNVPVTVVTA